MARQFLIYGGVLLAMLGWSLAPVTLRGWLFAPWWVAASGLIFAAGLESARLRRRAWLGQYLVADSPWHRRLRGGLLMIAGQLVLALLLALLLLIKLPALHAALWLLLLFSLPLLVLLRAWLNHRLSSHVKASALDALVRRLSVPLAMLPLAAGYVVMALHLPQPNMVGLSWSEAVPPLLAGGETALPAVLERLYLMVELSQQWALQNTLGDRGQGGMLALLGWSLLLVTSGGFIWAWTRLLVGADALQQRMR